MKIYNVVQKDNLIDLIRAVNNLINDEWSLVGGVSSFIANDGSLNYIQAIQKKD